MFGRLKRVHFVGIGGVGMSGIALVLKNLGFDVSGSDQRESSTTRALVSAGVRVSIGHEAANCADAEVVVYSSAVTADNPELLAAEAKGLPVIRRAEMLAELMRMKFSVAVAGSHGKTTVTSLAAHLLTRAGLDPTVVVGGRILGTDAGARLGRSEYMVAEADESDRSFLLLYPALAVVTNIEAEHLDVYKDLGDLRREFVRFVNRVPFYGSVVLCADSPAVRQLRPRVKRRVVTYALEQPADFRARAVQLYRFSSAFTLEFAGREVGRFSLGMAGRHNVLNALAALAVGAELGIDFKQMEQALATFAGIHRRLERRGEWDGVTLFDDYGHHPTEIRATLEALRNAYPEARILVAFQPHRFTRTRALAEDFGSCFDPADVVLVLKLYGAGEAPIEGVDETLVVESVRRHGRHGIDVRHVPEQADAVGLLRQLARSGDVVLTQGAGSITALADELMGHPA